MGHSITIAVIICVAFASVVPASATFRPDEAQSPTDRTLAGESHCYSDVTYRNVSFPAFGQTAKNLQVDGAVSGTVDSKSGSNDGGLMIQIARFNAEKVCLETNSSDGTKGVRLTFEQAEFENATLRGANLLFEQSTADSISFHVSEKVGRQLLSQFRSESGDGNESTGGNVTDPAKQLPGDIGDGDTGSRIPNSTDEVDNRTDEPRDSVDNTTDEVEDGAENTTDDVRDGVDNTTDTVDNTTDGAKETVDNTTDETKETVENTTDTVENTTDGVKDGVDDTTNDTKDTVDNTTDDTKETVDDTTGDTNETVDNTTDTVGDATGTVNDSVDDTKDTVDDTTNTVQSTTTTTTTTTDDATDGVTDLTNQTTTTNTTSTDTSTGDGSTDGTATTENGGAGL